jgi:dTDP-4-amino-4,6-dideoxygalactose transaminase
LTVHAISYADWSGAEYRAILRCILTGRVANGGNIARLTQRLTALYAPASVYPVNFGHTAIRMALALFVRRTGNDRNEVVIPRYICPSVVQSVQGAGLIPVMADVGADLNLTAASVQAMLGPRTLAVIAPHMFGCPADIGAIERVCRTAGVFLIDDAAQVIGITRDGRHLGTFGDIGVVSFAQSKTVVAGVRGAGGLLLVNNAELDEPLRAQWQTLAPARGRLHALVFFMFNYVW